MGWWSCFEQLGSVVVRSWKRLSRRPPDQSKTEQHPPDTAVPSEDRHSAVEDVGGNRNGTTELHPSPVTSTSSSHQGAGEMATLSITPDRLLDLRPSLSGSSPQPEISETSTLSHTTSAEHREDLAINRNGDSTDNLSDESLQSKSNLRTELLNARNESPEGSFRYFIADDDFNRIVTSDSISAELERYGTTCTNGEVKEISEAAPKLFAILVCLKRGRYIRDFLKEGIDDTDLPFVRSDKTKSGHFKLCSRKTPDRPIKCMTEWEQTRVNDFGRDQWCMFAPTFAFHDDIKHYELDDNCVLPWVEDAERSNEAIEGGYGSVWKIRIHPAHQQIHSSVGQKLSCRYVALKRLHLSDEQSFASEVEMLKLLGRRQDAHLVNLLATFSLKGRYYLLFPYAECNLREYWKRTPLPDFSGDTVSWTLGQCKAMTSALHTVHEYRPTRPPFHAFATSEAESPDTFDSSSENCIGLYGRHGDIKAENILWFCEEAMNERGDLVIADFGLTAFHKRATRSEIGHITGTPSYEAPETQLHSKISRAFDIWSLGCLYLEFVTWLVGGWEHLKRFPDARGRYTEPELSDDTFFTIMEGENQQRTAVVRQGVIEWIRDLHEMPRCSAFIHDLLDLISAKMLVVNPKERILSGPLNNELKCMIDKGVETPLYLTAPRPSSPRPQQKLQSSSLAAAVWNGLVRAPSPNEGMALPGRSSMASIPQISPGHLQSLDDISPPTSPRPDS